MKFEKGKQYKCVKWDGIIFTVGKVYPCEKDGTLTDNDRDVLVIYADNYDCFTLHEEVKRGDYALFWDGHESEAEKLIYLTTIEGAKYPYQAVNYDDMDNFENGKAYDIEGFKNMKPLPKTIEVPMKEALSILKANKGSDCVIVEDK